MSYVVSLHRSLFTFQAYSRGIYGGQNSSEAGLSPSTAVSPHHYQYLRAPFTHLSLS
jgi:hypothetical protein